MVYCRALSRLAPYVPSLDKGYLVYLFSSLVPRLYPRTQTNCNAKRGKAWDISSCDLTSDDVQVDPFYRKLVPTQAISLGSSYTYLGIYLVPL